MVEWTTPGTKSVNDVLTVTNLNTESANLQYIYDNRFDENNYGATPLLARASTALPLTTSYQDVGGGSLTLPLQGKWVLMAHCHFRAGEQEGWGEIYTPMQGRLTIAGTAQAGIAILRTPSHYEAVVTQVWHHQAATANQVCKLQAMYVTGGGRAGTLLPNTVLHAVLVGAP